MKDIKLCPLWGGEPRNAVKCLQDMCAFWMNGECAIVKIAKAVDREDDED